jgi:translation elongation factor EF-Tu-like GTPase
MKAKQLELLAPVEHQILLELLSKANFQGAQAPVIMSLLTKLTRARDVEVKEPPAEKEPEDENKDADTASEE